MNWFEIEYQNSREQERFIVRNTGSPEEFIQRLNREIFINIASEELYKARGTGWVKEESGAFYINRGFITRIRPLEKGPQSPPPRKEEGESLFSVQIPTNFIPYVDSGELQGLIQLLRASLSRKLKKEVKPIRLMDNPGLPESTVSFYLKTEKIESHRIRGKRVLPVFIRVLRSFILRHKDFIQGTSEISNKD